MCAHTHTHTHPLHVFLKSLGFILNWALTGKFLIILSGLGKKMRAGEQIRFISVCLLCVSTLLLLGIHCRGSYSQEFHRLVLGGSHWEGKPCLPVSCHLCFSVSPFCFGKNSSIVERAVLRCIETHLFKETFCNHGFRITHHIHYPLKSFYEWLRIFERLSPLEEKANFFFSSHLDFPPHLLLFHSRFGWKHWHGGQQPGKWGEVHSRKTHSR